MRRTPSLALLRAARRALIPAAPASASSAPRSTATRALSLCVRHLPLPVRAASSSRSSSSRAVIPQPQSVPAETFDELKAFLAEPVSEGPAQQRAKQIVRLMMQHHVFPAMPGQEATVMIMVADAMEDPAFAREVYACLRDAGVAPSPLTLELAARACAELGDWTTAGEVVEFMHAAIDLMHPSRDIYENAIAACARENKWMRAKQFLDEMLAYRLEAAPEVHLQCVALCVAADELTATKALLGRFLDSFDLEPEEVEDALTDLLAKAVAGSSFTHALYFRDQMYQRGFALTRQACADLVQLCAVERKWHHARALVAEFRGTAPPQAPKSSQYARDIQALLDDMMSAGFTVGLPIYNAALRNYVELKKDEDVIRVFDAMQTRGVAPDAVSYAAAIKACRTDVARADQLFQEMVNRDCAPSPNVYHAFLLTASWACEWQLLIDRYSAIVTVPSEKQLLDQDARILSLVAVAYGRLEQHQNMLQVFTSMKVRGLQPNLHVYGEAMYAYIQLGNWRHALLLFEHIHKEDIDPRKLAESSMIWDGAVLAAVEGKQPERAAALLSSIEEVGAKISPHTAVLLVETLTTIAAPSLWESFKKMEILHRITHRWAPRGSTVNDNPKVVNAILKRAVEARDVDFAEKLMDEAENEMAMVFNSMTYSLMLRLYASTENQELFHNWSERMVAANVKVTVFTYRAVLQHLKTLSDSECGRPAYFESILRLLDLSIDDADAADCTQQAVRIAGLILDRMERHGLLDALSLDFYLRLSHDPRDATRVLSALEAADDFQFSSNLLYGLFVTLGAHPDRVRVRAFLLKLLAKLPAGESDHALTGYCSSCSRDDALALLEELIQRDYELVDSQAVLFLVNVAPPDLDESGEPLAVPLSSDGQLPRLALLLKEADASLGSESMAFLIQRSIELSKFKQQQASQWSAALDADLDAMRDLLTHALSSYSSEQVREFLSQVVPQTDLWCLESVLHAIE